MIQPLFFFLIGAARAVLVGCRAAPGVYHGPPIFFSSPTLLNSKIEKHTFGTIVTLVKNTDYSTQSDGYFTCYIRSIGAGANKYVSMIVNREESFRPMVQEKDYIKQSIFVKKGMTIKYTLGSAMPEGTIESFIPFV